MKTRNEIGLLNQNKTNQNKNSTAKCFPVSELFPGLIISDECVTFKWQLPGVISIQNLPDSSSTSFFISSKTLLICSAFVTSNWNVFSLLLVADFKLCSPSFVKQVANAQTLILSSWMAVARPKPESQPVIRTYRPLMLTLAVGLKGFNTKIVKIPIMGSKIHVL